MDLCLSLPWKLFQMVKIEDLNFSYKLDSPLFMNFNWSLDRGERWSVIGPSGCGKTTLLYLLAGLRLPTSGKIILDRAHSNGHRAPVGLIFQDFGLLPWATAGENVALGLKIRGIEKTTAGEVAARWLAELGLESVSRHFPAELSGGQRQRVAIARTLALEPALTLMDEPFASIDTLTRESLQELTLNLWKKLQSTMVLVTHNIEEAVYWGNRIMVLGLPPHTAPLVVENPGSGSPEYRARPDFSLRCRQLRAMVEQKTSEGKP